MKESEIFPVPNSPGLHREKIYNTQITNYKQYTITIKNYKNTKTKRETNYILHTTSYIPDSLSMNNNE